MSALRRFGSGDCPYIIPLLDWGDLPPTSSQPVRRVYILFPLFPDGTAWDLVERWHYPQVNKHNMTDVSLSPAGSLTSIHLQRPETKSHKTRRHIETNTSTNVHRTIQHQPLPSPNPHPTLSLRSHYIIPTLPLSTVQGEVDSMHPPTPPPGPYPLTEQVCLEIALGATLALAYMHEKGFAHRDMKPHNILLRPTPRGGYEAVVMDLGSVAPATVAVNNRRDAIRTEVLKSCISCRTVL